MANSHWSKMRPWIPPQSHRLVILFKKTRPKNRRTSDNVMKAICINTAFVESNLFLLSVSLSPSFVSFILCKYFLYISCCLSIYRACCERILSVFFFFFHFPSSFSSFSLCYMFFFFLSSMLSNSLSYMLRNLTG